MHRKNAWVRLTFNTLYIDPYNKFHLTDEMMMNGIAKWLKSIIPCEKLYESNMFEYVRGF